MCEDCNIICAAVPTSLKDFDSCMRKDCNAFISLLSLSASDFDSCMREDCNKPRVSGGGASFILIHACARIATVLGGIVMARTNFNSCMREDCNWDSPSPRALAGHFDSCMREDCNTIAFLATMTTRGF